MARTFAEAIAAVEGSDFDAVVGYTVRRPEPAAVDEEVAAAFRDFDYGAVLRIERMLASRYHRHLADAEEAVHEVLEELLVKRVDLYRENPEGWMGLLYKLARFRLLDAKLGKGWVASIEELTELAGDAPFESARPCVPASQSAEEDAKYAPPPRDGEEWNRSQIIGALQRFRDHFGRPPKSTECRALNGLPSTSAIYRHFDSFADAVLAAGMVPEAPPRRGREWKPLEAAKVCRSFKRRNGIWPSWADVKRRPGELPGTSVMLRCFGGTRSVDVQLGAEAILAGVEE
jgi:hypothetical protein